jgi:transposase-like protein
MIFPIVELLDESESERWIARYFHPQGFGCPQCQTGVEQARVFRHSQRGLVDYRCNSCDRVYNLYTRTVFAGCRLSASQVVLLLRGVCKGESSASLAQELGVCRSTVHLLRQKVQANGYAQLAEGPVPDVETETDEMFQNAGEKRRAPRRSQRSTTATGQQTARARHL